MVIHCSQPIKEDIKQRLLNLGSNIKDNILWVFFSYFLKNEKKESNTIQTFFLMLEAKQINSKATIESSSIRV
jgi:hypothetical protein